jgi:hypothetical protein
LAAPDVVTSHVCDRRRNDVHPANRSKFVHQQEALMLELQVVLGTLTSIEVDDLAEERFTISRLSASLLEWIPT